MMNTWRDALTTMRIRYLKVYIVGEKAGKDSKLCVSKWGHGWNEAATYEGSPAVVRLNGRGRSPLRQATVFRCGTCGNAVSHPLCNINDDSSRKVPRQLPIVDEARLIAARDAARVP